MSSIVFWIFLERRACIISSHRKPKSERKENAQRKSIFCSAPLAKSPGREMSGAPGVRKSSRKYSLCARTSLLISNLQAFHCETKMSVWLICQLLSMRPKMLI